MLTDEALKLNPWPFIAIDALLLGSAYLIGSRYPAPMPEAPLFVVGGLVFTGAVLAAVPFVVNHTRRQEAALDERQQQIAALAKTTSESAEQLSIALAGLHAVTEQAHRAVKVADALPHKLQEKIHEFKQQLNEVSVTENEALSQEVNTLRSSETERLEGMVATVRKLCSEIARLEAATRKNINDVSASLAEFGTTLSQRANEAAESVARARAEAEAALVATQTSTVQAFEASLQRVLSSLEARLEAPSRAMENPAPAPVDPAPGLRRRSSYFQEPADPRAETLLTSDAASLPAARPTQPSEVTGESDAAHPPASTRPAAEVDKEAATTDTDEAPAPKSARKRPARRPLDDEGPLLGLDLPPLVENDDAAGATDEPGVPALSSDGLTRLVVTAYIGIGNRLFARGEGPGLSWEKGTPLQFVSIGKWRWETADATAPVRIRLYKNDEEACTSLGELLLEPAHQQDVSARF